MYSSDRINKCQRRLRRRLKGHSTAPQIDMHEISSPLYVTPSAVSRTPTSSQGWQPPTQFKSEKGIKSLRRRHAHTHTRRSKYKTLKRGTPKYVRQRVVTGRTLRKLCPIRQRANYQQARVFPTPGVSIARSRKPESRQTKRSAHAQRGHQRHRVEVTIRKNNS